MDYLTPLAEIVGFVGINTDILEKIIPQPDKPLYLSDADGVLIKEGKIMKQRGLNYFTATPKEKALGLPTYRKYTTNEKFLILVTTTGAYKYVGGDTPWSSIYTNALSLDERCIVVSSANIDDKIVITDSYSGIIKYYDGINSGNLLDPTTLKARFLLEHKTYLMLFRTIESGTEHYTRLKWSNPGAITIFDPEDSLDIASEGKIVNAKKMEDSIIVYFSDSIYRVFWSGEQTGFGSSPLSERIGLLAPNTLCGENIHYFLSQSGMVRLIPGQPPETISKNKFNKLVLDGIDPVYYERAIAFYFPNLEYIYLIYPAVGNSRNDQLAILDVRTGELVGKRTLPFDITCIGALEKDTDNVTLSPEQRIAGLSYIPLIGDVNGYVYQEMWSEYVDLGANPYTSSAVLPEIGLKDRTRNKRILQVDLLIEKLTDNDINLVLDIANEANENFSYNYNVTGSGNSGVRRYTVYTDVLGKEFKLRIRDSSNIYGFNLHGLILKGYITTIK